MIALIISYEDMKVKARLRGGEKRFRPEESGKT